MRCLIGAPWKSIFESLNNFSNIWEKLTSNDNTKKWHRLLNTGFRKNRNFFYQSLKNNSCWDIFTEFECHRFLGFIKWFSKCLDLFCVTTAALMKVLMKPRTASILYRYRALMELRLRVHFCIHTLWLVIPCYVVHSQLSYYLSQVHMFSSRVK